MKPTSIILNLIVLSSSFLFVGCAFKGQYQPELLSKQLSSLEAKYDGKALVVTSLEDDQKNYNQGPTSLTGAATKLNVNVGSYLKEISVEVFSRLFKEGAIHSNDNNHSGNYTIVINPKILNYEWRFNQLKNLGFAITPETKIDLVVTLKDSKGNTLLNKEYKSDFTSGGTYLASIKPHEKVNKSIHQSIYNLLINVASDIEKIL